MEVQTQEKSLYAKEGSKGSAAAAEMTVVNETETAVLASDDMEVEVNQQVKVLSNMNPDEELAGRAKAMNKEKEKEMAQMSKKITDTTKQSEGTGMDVDVDVDVDVDRMSDNAGEDSTEQDKEKKPYVQMQKEDYKEEPKQSEVLENESTAVMDEAEAMDGEASKVSTKEPAVELETNEASEAVPVVASDSDGMEALALNDDSEESLLPLKLVRHEVSELVVASDDMEACASNSNARTSEESLQQAKDKEKPAAQMLKEYADTIEQNNATDISSKCTDQSSGGGQASAINAIDAAEVFGEASKASEDVVATDDGMGEAASASASHHPSSNSQNQLTRGYIPGPAPLAHNHNTNTNANTPQQQPLTWIYPTSTNSSYSERQYQLEITRTALSFNTLVSLPTGLGKTLISAVVMYNYYRWFPTGKVVFLAPTCALVNQQIQACYNIMGIPELHTAEMTGKTIREKRGRLWKERRLFFCTPQTMEGDLRSDNCDGTRVVCIVFDEAHKAVKEYAYVKVLQQLNACGARFRVLALSATPGKDIATIQTVIQTLNVSRIEARWEEDEEVKRYTHTVEKEIMYLEPTEDVHMGIRLFDKVLDPILNQIRERGGLRQAGLQRNTTVTSHGMRMEYNLMVEQRNDFSLKAFQQPVGTLLRAREALKEHDVRIARTKLIAFASSAGHNSSIGNKITSSKEYLQLWKTVVDGAPLPIEDVKRNNPKLQKVDEMLREHFERARACGKGDTKAIIFSTLRESVQEIVSVLQSAAPLVRAVKFVGRSTTNKDEVEDVADGDDDNATTTGKKSFKTKGMTSDEQKKTIENFRNGIHNVLVCTSIGEEGLDIGATDLIINFDCLRSPLRMVQREGRTGRSRAGRVICLVYRGQEEKKLRESEAQTRTLWRTLRNTNGFHLAKNVPLLPEKPVLERRDMQVRRTHTSSAEESSEEEYDIDDPRQEIIEILEEVESPGTFVVGGSCDGKLIMPGLEVEGMGPIGLPLSPNIAKDLVKRCEQAPFGRGSKTIVDKTVRNTFQLEPEHFKITNPSWTKELGSLTKQACQDLGVEAHLKVEARIYKLLVYEEGSFFAPHRDSEKEEGMFGTLVVILPSHFSGGELVVKHKGDTETFEQGALSKFESQYAAFYADCKHELKKVTTGHRLCLVYNLVKVGFGSRPSAADNCAVMNRLRNAARLWGKEYDNNKVVRMTDHYYTPAGIHLGDSSKYKGSDAALVQLLDLAIEKGVDIDYDYGKVSLSESGTGEGDCYGYSRWGDEDGDEDYCWGETTDRSISLDLSTWGSMNIDEEEEMVPPDYFEGQEPTNETFEPTGNAGVEAERQYDDAGAIIIWPRSQRWRIVTRNDTSKMCDYVLKACKEGTPDSEPRQECIEKANTILSRVENNSFNPRNVENMMKCVMMIGDETLAKRFLTSCIASNSTTAPQALMENLQPFVDCFGSNVVNPIFLTSINSTRFIADPSGTATFLIRYCNTIGFKASNKQLTENLVEAFVDLMSPPDKTGRNAPKKSIDTFPLNRILDLFIVGNQRNSGTLVNRILEGYVWMSCQKISEPYRHYSYSNVSAAPKGPVKLLSAAPSLVSVCEKFGWKENEATFVEASKTLSLYGNANIVFALVEKISPIAMSSPGHVCERSRICAQMSSVACEKVLATFQKSTTLDTCKRLVRIIGKYCPSFAPRFTQSAKQLDVSSVLYPLVADNALRAGTTDVMQGSLRLLTNHCAWVLNSRLSGDLGAVEIWTVLNAHHSKNSMHSSFLKSPCMKTYDEKVRKSDHNGFFQDLALLIRSGEIKAESYQPRGRGKYHFKITKLKSRRVPMANLVSLSCSCGSSRYLSYRSQHLSTSECLLKTYRERLSKYNGDKSKLCIVEALLTPEQQSQLGSRKRSANPSASSTAGSGQMNHIAGTVTNPYRASASTSTPAVRNPYRSSFASATANTGPTFSAIATTNASSASSANPSVIRRPGQPAAKKQKALPEVVDLLDDDDDVQIEEVLDLRQAIHKRVKDAESKGEIIEIS
uniref:Uncharacterized protein n=1 Tax=Chaetoceros debilis TaxID=122233 RepID=A0A7S3VEI6_9STRA